MTVNEKINISDKKAPVVLLAPLDWGLGHATRCIPLIKHLLLIGCEVIIASEGKQHLLLKQEFTKVRFVHVKGYHIKYSKKSWQTGLKIFLQIPKILTAIKNENSWVQTFILENRVDAIISDNRYGFYNTNVPSVFITHQLTIKSPFGGKTEKLLRRINYYFIEKFSACWVPDYRGDDNLAAELSHPARLPNTRVDYLGKISRMNSHANSAMANELLIILSGPEPQRTILENLLLQQLNESNIQAVLVRGLPGEQKLPACTNKEVIIHNHLSAIDLNKVINDSKIIISRSGYSTVMDLMGLNKRCIFIPTPGQTEQEYLARYLSSKKFCISFSQQSFLLSDALRAANSVEMNRFDKPVDTYQKVLEDFVRRLKIQH